MVNGDVIRGLDNKGLADFLICVKCPIASPGHCFYRKEQALHDAIWGKSDNVLITRCSYWQRYKHWLDEAVEVVE